MNRLVKPLIALLEKGRVFLASWTEREKPEQRYTTRRQRSVTTAHASAIDNSALYLRLLNYVKPYWRIFAISIVAMVVMAITEPALPAIMKPLLDGSFVNKDPELISIMPFLLIGLFAIRGIATYVSTVAIAWVANKVVLDIREEMFIKLISLPSKFYDDHASGNLMSKVTYDVTQVTSAATHVLIVLVRDTLSITGLLGLMLYLNWKLTLLVLLVAPLIALVVKLISYRLRNLSRLQQEAMGDMNHILEESIAAHKVVKVYGGHEYE
ncbi:MAG: ATP-binding cassette subfamily B bacterial MsbA, partial [Halothiobacillaceae bacterium]